MKVQVFPIVLLATAVSGYHYNIGIPAATAIREQENNMTESLRARITEGQHSIRRMHPFFGGLIIYLTSNLTSLCGSSLLSHTKLVTAAHCWDDGTIHATHLMVVLGSVRLFSGGTRILTDKVVTHEAYDASTVKNDIAIITIRPVEYNDYIKPIDLPEGPLLHSTYEGVYAGVVGYGKTSSSAGIFVTQSLRYAVVSVMGAEGCSVYGEYFHNGSMICTNGLFGSPCGGDSGGPLFIYGNGVTYLEQCLIGIVSYGSPNGCNSGQPTVYTRVSSYIDWIKARI